MPSPRATLLDTHKRQGGPATPDETWQPRIRLSIEQLVARVFGVARRELALATRGPAKVALARQVAMYLAHVVYGLNLTQVGRVFDRDRTTVAHACAIVEDQRDDLIFDRVLDNLEAIIHAWSKRAITTTPAPKLPTPRIGGITNDSK